MDDITKKTNKKAVLNSFREGGVKQNGKRLKSELKKRWPDFGKSRNT